MKISATALKYFAIIIMTIDHIALLFISENTAIYYVMRVIGRMTAPIMTYFVVEGFRYTRNRWKYLRRMAVFAVIAQLPYSLMVQSAASLNVMYTFSVALIMLTVIEDKRLNSVVKALLTAVCFGLSAVGDWQFYIPLWCLVFWRFRGDFKNQAFCLP